jgi:hypothetical protein
MTITKPKQNSLDLYNVSELCHQHDRPPLSIDAVPREALGVPALRDGKVDVHVFRPSYFVWLQQATQLQQQGMLLNIFQGLSRHGCEREHRFENIRQGECI